MLPDVVILLCFVFISGVGMYIGFELAKWQQKLEEAKKKRA